MDNDQLIINNEELHAKSCSHFLRPSTKVTILEDNHPGKGDLMGQVGVASQMILCFDTIRYQKVAYFCKINLRY